MIFIVYSCVMYGEYKLFATNADIPFNVEFAVGLSMVREG